jgi:hypothetical protein
VLDRSGSYACYEVKGKVVSPYGNIRLFSRDAYVGTALAGIEVTFMKSLEGLEARIEGQCVATLKGYRANRKLPSWEREHLPPILCFEKYEGLSVREGASHRGSNPIHEKHDIANSRGAGKKTH